MKGVILADKLYKRLIESENPPEDIQLALNLINSLNLDLDILGYIDPNITINIIKDDVRVDKYHVELPKEIVNIIKCKNPRCITSVEQELNHVFVLTDKDKKAYRCKYCETLSEK